eukprot:scaffold24546_cov35-Tisochrysis_lutea.AAC.1
MAIAACRPNNCACMSGSFIRTRTLVGWGNREVLSLLAILHTAALRPTTDSVDVTRDLLCRLCGGRLP